MALEDVRKQINQVDDELLELLDKRLACSRQVAANKIVTQDYIFKPEREKQIYDRIIADGKIVSMSVMKSIIRNSRQFQYEIYVDEGKEHKEFINSLDEHTKQIFETGGILKLKLKADKTCEKALNINDIIMTVADTGLDILRIGIENDIVDIEINVTEDEASRKKAYVISYMLFMETMH